MLRPPHDFFPDAFFVVNSVGGAFRQVFTNPFETPQIDGINLTVELLPSRHAATIENAWSDKSEVRPGEPIRVKVVLQPYRGERLVREVSLTIPLQASPGELRVLVSDATLLNRLTQSFSFPGFFPGMGFGPRVNSLEQLISLLNRERRNDRLYVAVFQQAPTLLVGDKVLPNVPLSQMNVLNHQAALGRPGNLLFFSVLNENSEPLDQVLTGSHWLRLTVRWTKGRQDRCAKPCCSCCWPGWPCRGWPKARASGGSRATPTSTKARPRASPCAATASCCSPRAPRSSPTRNWKPSGPSPKGRQDRFTSAAAAPPRWWRWTPPARPAPSSNRKSSKCMPWRATPRAARSTSPPRPAARSTRSPAAWQA